MVDSDNAKSKREFKKLSKCTGDKLDKENGRYAPQTPTLGPTIPNEPIWPSIPRSIQELEAPDFKHNHSTEMIGRRAAEKERQKAKSGAIIKRNQFTFSVEQPPVINAAPAARKPDTKPSPEFNDSIVMGLRSRTAQGCCAAQNVPVNQRRNSNGEPPAAITTVKIRRGRTAVDTADHQPSSRCSHSMASRCVFSPARTVPTLTNIDRRQRWCSCVAHGCTFGDGRHGRRRGPRRDETSMLVSSTTESDATRPRRASCSPLATLGDGMLGNDPDETSNVSLYPSNTVNPPPASSRLCYILMSVAWICLSSVSP